jgi:hypothetical protein
LFFNIDFYIILIIFSHPQTKSEEFAVIMVLLSMARRYATPTLGQLKAVHFGKKLLLDKDHIKDLPEAYKNFYKEWKWQKPTPLYYIPEETKYQFNEKTGNAYEQN